MGLPDINVPPQTLLSVVGGAAVVSVAHYLLTFTQLRGDVAVQFDLEGRPRRFFRKTYFVIYPAVVSAAAAAGYSITEGGQIKVPAEAKGPVSVVVAVAAAGTAVLQYYAAAISQGKKTQAPKPVTVGIFGAIVASAAYAVAKVFLKL